ANFLHIAEQKGLFNSLSTIHPTLDHGATSNSADVQSFLTFANAIIQIEKNHCKAQHKCKAKEKHCANDQDIKMLTYKLDLLAHCFDMLNLHLPHPQAEPNGKPKPKKVKVFPAYTNLKPGNKAMLLLLS
ncbi:hypothetical protein C0989_005767, partial [Termitomyces sp. Mn162]